MTRSDPAWLDLMYNNRARVADHAAYFSRWAETSAEARASQACILDLPFGPSPGQTLDVFPAASPDQSKPPGAPVLVFIHGGYWRSLDKADHSFIAPAFTRSGTCVVIPNYDLCPAVSIPQITMQMVAALAWTYRNIARYGGNPEAITVVGHSAGGHLAAMLLTCDWPAYAPDLPSALIQHALSISGVYDLEPMRHTPSVKDSLKVTPEQVLQASPNLLPCPPQRTLYSVVGGDESDEFLRQNRLIQQAWGRRAVPVCEALPALNHFSVLDAITDPTHRLHHLALQRLRDTAG